MRILGKNITRTSAITFVLSAILLGFLAKLGEDVYELIKPYTYQSVNVFFKWALRLLTKTIKINVLSFMLIIAGMIPVYRLLYKYVISRLFSETIFLEDFTSSANFWAMNYWGSTNPSKTNRIENSTMIFEAKEVEWPWRNLGQGGAFHDLRSGITKGLYYKVECRVKSTPGTSMRFKLWLHDTTEKNQMSTDPETPPSDDYKVYSLKFKATDARAIRIHLHCFGGKGKIIVDQIKIIRK